MAMNSNVQLLGYGEVTTTKPVNLSITFHSPLDKQNVILLTDSPVSPTITDGSGAVKLVSSTTKYSPGIYKVIPMGTNCTVNLSGTGPVYLQALASGFDSGLVSGAQPYTSFTDRQGVDTSYFGMKHREFISSMLRSEQ